MKIYYLLIFFVFSVVSLFAQQENHILLVVPESDTVQAWGDTYRLSASTEPGSKVWLNGTEIKVYGSGAFCGALEVQSGTNNYELKSINSNGKEVTKSFVIIRKEYQPKELPGDSLVIQSIRTFPELDSWLNTGDVLDVIVRAAPGMKCTFLDGRLLKEVSYGNYTGRYIVNANDVREESPLKIKLADNEGNEIESESKNKIAFKSAEFPMVAVTKNERAPLSYGLGTNRLGGAKLSFINEGIKLKITGKIGEMYRIELSPDNEAWIDQDEIDFLGSDEPLPFSLSGSWTVNGDDKYDYVNIALYQKLPYSSYQELEPNRIFVDIYGAVSNTNWITQLQSAKEIKNVDYLQPQKNVLRVIIELKQRQNWGYAINYVNNTLQIKVKRQPELDLSELTIAVDAGHGGRNNGALGSTGLTEKEVNLSIAKLLKKELESRGANVIMTREDDTYEYNSVRLKKVIEKDPDLLVSIHSNSIGLTTNPADTKGTGTFYKHIAFRPLSQFVWQRMLDLGLEPLGNVGKFNFTLNSETGFPNVLVETAFMSNPEDEMLLMNPEFREEIAEAVADGLEDFLDWCDD